MKLEVLLLLTEDSQDLRILGDRLLHIMSRTRGGVTANTQQQSEMTMIRVVADVLRGGKEFDRSEKMRALDSVNGIISFLRSKGHSQKSKDYENVLSKAIPLLSGESDKKDINSHGWHNIDGNLVYKTRRGNETARIKQVGSEYVLSINGREVGTFPSQKLAKNKFHSKNNLA